MRIRYALFLAVLAPTVGCSAPPDGLGAATPARTTVKMDFFAKPLPEIALPNDIATRYDETSPTLRRINASTITPTAMESRTRELVDKLDGWGVLQPVTVPFTGLIDIDSLRERHDDVDYATEDDAIYVINIDRDSPNYGAIQHLDVGNGNYPVVHEKPDLYWPHDPHGDSLALLYEEADEDLNRNGRLDPGEDVNGNGTLDAGEDLDGDGQLDPPEDTDADGLLDAPNYLPGHNPAADDLAGRADALMSFYERNTNTLIVRPLVPYDDRTTYAVVVTRRILDAGGEPIGSPYPTINHTAQTKALLPLLDVLPPGLAIEDIAFTYSFTTQTIRADWQAVRDGLYSLGPQAHLGSEYPARVEELLPMRDTAMFPGMSMPHLLYGEVWGPALAQLTDEVLGGGSGEQLTQLVEGTGYVDYFVVGRFTSPQLMPRPTPEEVFMPLHNQVWPQDLATTPAPAHGEAVYFTLAVPRKEVSVRGEGKPAPLVILGHGYTGNRFDTMQLSSYFARHGLAVMSIDGPSHGVSITVGEKVLATALLSEYGLSAAGTALLTDRAWDQNYDGVKDSGADFWTSYLFHTRDMVRQFALDYMQLVRVVRGFDGTTRWSHDLDGNGENDLAGDFDADGVVDIGAGAPFYAWGGSLGGIMSMILGAVEPAVDVIAPVSGGGGYGDLGPRSTQGGVYQAFILRAMGPLFLGAIDAESGDLMLETIVTDLNSSATVPIARVGGLAPWDTMLVENLRNGVRRCAFISAEGTVRASSEANKGDRIRISFFKGPQLLAGSEHCEFRAEAKPFAEVDTFGEAFSYQGMGYPAGSPLITLMEGLGMRRGHPDFRRLSGIGQLVLDPSDPAALAPYLLESPLVYGNGEQTGAHALIVSTMGDSSVPVSGGQLVGRAAGLIDYLTPDPRYGMPVNQLLIDTYTTEGVHNLERYVDSQGEGIHLDLENFAEGTDYYGEEVPRYDTPPRIGFGTVDALGGVSAAIFPYNLPTGQHGFDLPGQMTDKARTKCLRECGAIGENPCGCKTLETFDIGNFMLNMTGRYFSSGGTVLNADMCQSRGDCPDLPDLPPARDLATLQ